MRNSSFADNFILNNQRDRYKEGYMKSFAGRLGRWEKSKAGNSLELDKKKSGELLIHWWAQGS